MKYVLRDKKEMKDSGVEWIGEIPEGWDARKLKFLAKVNASNVDKKGYEDEDEVSLCNYTDVYKNERITSGMKFMLATASKDQIRKLQLRPEDVLATKDSETADDIFVPALVEESIDNLVCGYHLYHIRSKPNVLSGAFLFRYLQNHLMRAYTENYSNGVTRFGISQYPVLSLPVMLPDVKEQDKIVEFLDEKTAMIDEVVKKKKKQIELLKEKRAALITQAVTKGLDLNVKMKDSGVEWIGEIPEGWEVRKLKSLCRIVTGNTPPKVDEENYCLADGTLWIKPDDLHEFIPVVKTKLQLTDDGLRLARRIPRNTVLVNCIGDVGKMGVSGADATTNQQINALLFNRLIDVHFGMYMIFAMKGAFAAAANSVVVAILNKTGQGNVQTALPSLSDQKRIVGYLNERVSIIDETIKKIQKSIKLIQEHRSSLISHAVTGKIIV